MRKLVVALVVVLASSLAFAGEEPQPLKIAGPAPAVHEWEPTPEEAVEGERIRVEGERLAAERAVLERRANAFIERGRARLHADVDYHFPRLRWVASREAAPAIAPVRTSTSSIAPAASAAIAEVASK